MLKNTLSPAIFALRRQTFYIGSKYLLLIRLVEKFSVFARSTNNSLRNSVFQHDPRGSSLLVTLLLTSILLVLGLGFHRLILDTIRLERNVVSSGNAYYHAEAGIEEALYRADANLPGYEVALNGDANGDGMPDYHYQIRSLSSAAAQAVPCDYDTRSLDTSWMALGFNESITLPLLRDHGGTEQKIEHFKVEYYLDPWPTGFSGDEILVLRWKIFGLKDNETSALSAFVPVLKNASSSDNPTYFGTDGITGNPAGFLPNGTTAQFRDCSGNICVFYEQYDINTFLTTTDLRSPFIVLTNVFDVSVLSDVSELDDYVLYVRMREELVAADGTSTEPLVCERVRIESDGAFQNISDLQKEPYRQNLNVDMGLDDFLPVFDFALYRTKNR